ncbi:Predicted oxidoreductase [Paenibacillus sp. UNCCL117]|uniref:aldo/keto reductase n=1 Tax=unclassified Paenibacillus TaxID=185978 RepID=UPI00088996C2|nr:MULTISPECIES: aldo/keto reductase [unclassified Paenibacillus]SDE18723.1 Predicted oxidoreductase [Paenibacillus sp. cl123]SFW62156.1 Predicted oxidoreductase [Paenibacillus sp. UNCCL117]
MDKKRIVNTELDCSPIVLGSVLFGSKLTEEQSFRLMDTFVDAGGNMVDTAQVYANWLPGERSLSETTVGRWMKARGNRARLIVTTKGAHPEPSAPQIRRLTPELIAEDLEGSMRRLQVDELDLYWLHRDDPSRPVGEILHAMNEWVQKGKIRYFGCSNWRTHRMEEARAYASEHGIQGFVASQVSWSLAEVDLSRIEDTTLMHMDETMYRYHQERQMAVFAYSSQAQGLFSKLEESPAGMADERIAKMYRLEENKRRYERAKQLSEELSVPISRVVLAYMLAQPIQTFPIVGCRTDEQLEDSLRAAEISLSPEQLAFLQGKTERAE